jgi:PKD repeat protein
MRSGLNLLAGQTYYASVQARNAGGLWSSIATSNGVVAGAGVCPTAGFSAMPTSGPIPLRVQFTDASSGTYTFRQWDFGDSMTSTLPDPQHIYTKTGTYTVTLQISGAAGLDSLVQPKYITVTQNKVYLPVVLK